MKRLGASRSLFSKYLLSYAVILMIPTLFMGYFINNQFMGVLENELIANNVNTLNRVMYVVNTNVRQFQSIQNHILLNRKLDIISGIKNPYAALEAMDELRKYASSNSFVKDMAIYYHGDEFIYTTSSSYTLSAFTTSSYKYQSWSEKEFAAAVNSITQPSVRPAEAVKLNNSESLKLVTFLYPVAKSGIPASAVLVFMVDENFFRSIMSDNLNASKVNIVILDQNNQMITCLKNEDYITSINYNSLFNEHTRAFTGNVKIENQDFLISSIASPENGWKYVSITPVQYVLGKTFAIQVKFIVIVIILLFTGSIVIYFNMQTNYKPIRQLKAYADKIYKDSSLRSNEIEAVKGAIDYLSTQNTKLVKDTQAASRDFILSGLLKGRIKSLEELNSKGQNFGISFIKPNCMVLITLFHFPAQLPALNHLEMLQHFENTLRRFFDAYALDFLEQNKIVAILSLDKQEELTSTESIRSFHQLLKGIYGIPLTLGAGNVYHAAGNIPKSYIEASAAIDYRLVKGTDIVIFNHELVAQDDSLDSYPHKELDMLNYLIKQGNADEIERILSSLLGYIKTCDLPLFIARGLCFDLVNITSKAIIEVNRELRIGKSEYPTASLLAEFETVDELTSVVKNICSNICTYIRESKFTHDTTFLSGMLSHIADHSLDSNFSIQNMADHFGMTLTNLSQYFKNQTGQTIIDYTTNLRMEKAKELLVTSKLSLNEICAHIGYINSSSFIRRFKQLTGLTPRQYAEKRGK